MVRILAIFLISTPLFAGEVIVTAPQAQMYDAPNGNAIIGTVARGKKIQTEDESEGGYYRLKTKSGRSIWVKDTDVRLLHSSVENDLVTEDDDFARFTWDIGFSTGNTGGDSYSEASVGLNYFLKRWVAWRNSAFGRFIRPENVYGLDTSARFFYDLSLGRKSSITIFGGPGYRFVTLGSNVPFVEGGLVMHFGGLSIGGGAKTFFTQVAKPGASSDTQYFLIIAGGGAF